MNTSAAHGAGALDLDKLFAARLYAARVRPYLATALFALNPNLLYLQTTPMTEPPFFAALMALLYFSVRFRET